MYTSIESMDAIAQIANELGNKLRKGGSYQMKTKVIGQCKNCKSWVKIITIGDCKNPKSPYVTTNSQACCWYWKAKPCPSPTP